MCCIDAPRPPVSAPWQRREISRASIVAPVSTQFAAPGGALHCSHQHRRRRCSAVVAGHHSKKLSSLLHKSPRAMAAVAAMVLLPKKFRGCRRDEAHRNLAAEVVGVALPRAL